MKAIIMAGGEGSRLRPLTCDLPKPMVPVMNKPVMTYSIDLLKKYKIIDIGVTLQYLPMIIKDYFGTGENMGVRLQYYIEESPLGTAGSVKNADKFLDETFIVISGDALTDIDINKAVKFHKEKESKATIVLKRVDVPIEYGVIVTNQSGSVTRFLEKPNWGEVFSDTVNTGIYIIEPEVLEYIPKNKKFDFSQDLFPMLLKDNQPMYGYITDEYWCDIGNVQTYMQAHFDFLNRDISFPINGFNKGDNIWIGENTIIDNTAKIEGPCFIGDYCSIGPEVQISPYTIIGDYNTINRNTSTKRTIFWANTKISENVETRGAVICNKVTIGANTAIYEGAVIGEGTNIDKDCVVKPEIKIWPDKYVEQGMVVNENIIWGTRINKTIFGKDGISGENNTTICPQNVARLGAAFGAQLKPEKKVAIASDDKPANIMLKYALISGLLSSGIEVYDMGELTTPILRYAVKYFGLHGGVNINANRERPEEVHINFMDENGCNLSPGIERKIENLYTRDDYNRQPSTQIHNVNTINDVTKFYVRNLLNAVDMNSISKSDIFILVSVNGNRLESIITEIMEGLGCRFLVTSNIKKHMKLKDYDIACILDENGEDIKIYSKNGELISNDLLNALIALIQFKTQRENEVVVPFNAPLIIEKIAQEYNGNVIRSKSSKQAIMSEMIKRSHDEKPINAFSLYFDKTALLIKIIEIMSNERKSLADIIAEIPKFHTMERLVKCPIKKKGKVMRSLIEEELLAKHNIELFEGIKVKNEKGWSLIIPDSEEPVCRIYTEGYTQEYAEELTNFYEQRINNIKNH